MNIKSKSLSKRYLILSFVLVCAMVASGCQTDKNTSNQLLQPGQYTVESLNEGTDDSQKVIVKINYEEMLDVAKGVENEFKITISDKKINKENYTVAADQANLVITIKIENGVTEGRLAIQANQSDQVLEKVTDTTKKKTAKWKNIDCLIPTGVKLETVAAVNGTNQIKAKVVKKVITTQKVRGVTWLNLSDNGVIVPGTYDPASAKMKGAVAVHGHEFLTDNQEMIAQSIADILNSNFKDKYKITSEGDEFSVEALAPMEGETLDVQIYLY